MKKYNILILSNKDNEEFIEDTYIAESFRKDGHYVEFLWVDYDESLDSKFDIIIRRNTWVEDDKQIDSYNINNNLLEERLIKKSIKTVNLVGLDGEGKEYLCKLYKQGKKVIPSADNIKEAKEFNLYFVSKIINYNNRNKEIPEFWDEVKLKYPEFTNNKHYGFLDKRGEIKYYYCLLDKEFKDSKFINIKKCDYFAIRINSFESKDIIKNINKVKQEYIKSLNYKLLDIPRIEIYYNDYVEILIPIT